MSSRPIHETELHELDVIDAIVRGGGEARPEDAALTDFALLVRNARPVPNHGEVAALDTRAQNAIAESRPRERMIFKPAFASFCALILVVGVAGIFYLGSPGQPSLVSRPTRPSRSSKRLSARRSQMPTDAPCTCSPATSRT